MGLSLSFPARRAPTIRQWLAVVAEGVETDAEQAFLQAYGCFMAQGFLHARPIPAPEFEAWLAMAVSRGAGAAAPGPH